jgi:hypothetical protein
MTDAQILDGFHAALERWFEAHDACLAGILARREAHNEQLRRLSVGRDRSIVEINHG